MTAFLPRFRRSFRPSPARAAGWATALTACLGLAGCGGPLRLQQVIYIAVGTSPDQVINGTLHQEVRERLTKLEQGYHQLHPDIRFRFSLYPEATLLEALKRRQWAGLEPDLIFVTGRTAHQLRMAGLTRPFPASPQLLANFDPALVKLVQNPDGSLNGLPILRQLQVACYDTRRISKPPATIEALLAAGAAGQPIGLSLTPDGILWTLGSLGALPAVERTMEGQPVSAADRGTLRMWLAWLQNASSQQRVSFYANQEQAEAELRMGQFAWIPCRSTTLPRLRRAMGDHLGVAPLPDGAGSSASPVNYTRVMALGSNSTERARLAAIRFSEYTVNPLVQRALAVGSYTVLPANRHVMVPVSSSSVLAALVRARDQGDQTNRLRALLHPGDRRPAQMQDLLTALVFGEVTVDEATTRMIRILQEHR